MIRIDSMLECKSTKVSITKRFLYSIRFYFLLRRNFFLFYYFCIVFLFLFTAAKRNIEQALIYEDESILRGGAKTMLKA